MQHQRGSLGQDIRSGHRATPKSALGINRAASPRSRRASVAAVANGTKNARPWSSCGQMLAPAVARSDTARHGTHSDATSEPAIPPAVSYHKLTSRNNLQQECKGLAPGAGGRSGARPWRPASNPKKRERGCRRAGRGLDTSGPWQGRGEGG